MGQKVEYIDVVKDAGQMDRMLTYSKGKRQIPVIVAGDHVTIGFKGKT